MLIMIFVMLISGIRFHTLKFASECVMDMGLNSTFSEYHRGLFDRYGLLYIDSAYGGNEASLDDVSHHLLHYMNINLGDTVASVKSPINLKADNCELSGITYASDSKGEVLRYQIRQFMKSKMSIGELGNHYSDEVDMDDLIGKYNDYNSKREAENERIDAIVDDINSKLPEDEEPYSVSNPADAVESLGGDAVLYYAIGDSLDIPMAFINKNDYISKRTYSEGAGLRNSQKKVGVADKALLLSYLYEVCGYYGNVRDGSRLQFQLEYIIANEDSDKKNLEEVAKYIFMSRYPINMAYLLTNPAKKAEAEAMALVAASAILSPELTEAITYSILFAWGYAESAKDLRMVFDGHSVPMVKSDSTWNTPLSQMINFKSYLGVYHASGGQLDYKKYLRGLLVLKSTEDISMRLMDIMEMDIRKMAGNEYFAMNNQIYQLTANVNLSSGFGSGFSIKRFYSYE